MTESRNPPTTSDDDTTHPKHYSKNSVKTFRPVYRNHSRKSALQYALNSLQMNQSTPTSCKKILFPTSMYFTLQNRRDDTASKRNNFHGNTVYFNSLIVRKTAMNNVYKNKWCAE